MINLPKKRKFSRKKDSKESKTQSSDLNTESFLHIPKESLKEHHDYNELSNDVQKELELLLSEKLNSAPIEKEEEKEPISNKKKHSPYIVNLKTEISTVIDEENHITKTEINTINLIKIADEDIQHQFTPMLTEMIHRKYREHKQKNKLALILVTALFLIVCIDGLYFFQKMKTTQTYIMNLTQEAFHNINDGYLSLRSSNYNNANNKFSIATRQFIDAEKELSNINPFVRNALSYIPSIGDKFNTGYHAIQAGSRLALSAKFISRSIDEITHENQFSDKLEILQDTSLEILPLLNETQKHFAQINLDYIPEDKKEIFLQVKKQIPVITLATKNFNNVSDFLIEALGAEEKKRYLIPFQNNAEIRSSGGFIGSFALIDIYKGEITNLEIPNTGSYQLQGGLQKNIIPPKPLQLISERWEFQDSNWDADFKTAAQQMENLFTLSWGPSVDGVIAINLPVMENLLDIIGDVDLPKYDKTLNSENFWKEVQTNVEIEYDKDLNNPKQIITDMTPIVIDRITHSSTQQMFKLLVLMNQSLIEKNVLMYFKNSENQKLIETYDWAGRIKQNKQDYLYVVNNNIAGGKTDRVIRQTITHDSEIMANGEIINTVKIKREHTGEKGDDFTGIQNVSYLRVYVPKGSELISADGFRIPDKKYFKEVVENAVPDPHTFKTEKTQSSLMPSNTTLGTEFNKTVFGNWTMTKPGQTSEIILKYKLPFEFTLKPEIKANDNGVQMLNNDPRKFYSLYIQKQPGTQSIIKTSTKLPNKLEFNNAPLSNIDEKTFILDQDMTIKYEVKRK